MRTLAADLGWLQAHLPSHTQLPATSNIQAAQFLAGHDGALAQAASERDTPYAVFLEEVLRAERQRIVEAALRALPKREQDVATCRYLLELSVAELGLTDALEIARYGTLIFTWPGSNAPSVRVGEDLTYQAIRAVRGFERLEAVAVRFRALERVLHDRHEVHARMAQDAQAGPLAAVLLARHGQPPAGPGSRRALSARMRASLPISTGLTRWWSKPAWRDMSRSRCWP